MELKQTKEWVGKIPNPIPASLWLSLTLLPENLGMHCREWPAGKTESEIKLLSQENSKPRDLIVGADGLVSKDQLGRGFIVNQTVSCQLQFIAYLVKRTVSCQLQFIATLSGRLYTVSYRSSLKLPCQVARSVPARP